MPRPLAVTRALIRLASGALTALLLALWSAPAAFAHTELESTAPAHGAVSDGPVGDVALRFTLPVTSLGDGIVINGPAGTVPADVTAAEGGVLLVATPSDPLPDGEYTVSWTVAAQDGHPLDGSFDFTVAGAGPGPTEPAGGTPSSGPGETAEPGRDGDGESHSGSDGTDHDTDHDADHGAGHGAAHDMGHDPAAMDSPATNTAEAVARIGSAAALWGGLVAAGGLMFAGLVLRGPDEDDIPVVLRVVRWTGGLILAGLLVRVMAGSVLVAHGDLAAAFSPSAVGDSLTDTTRWEVGLQAVGAVAVTVGARHTVRGSWLAVLGSVLVGAGHVLGGHSNTAEPRWLVVAADVAHLAGAATWVGGVVTLGILLQRRRRDGRDLDAAEIGARFSVVAAVSIAVVGAAGVVLAVQILDRPEQLLDSRWGLLLLAKIGLVAVVGAIGTHNHFRVVPRLVVRRTRVRRARKAGDVLRRSAVRETTLMVAIVLVTAWLVAASVAA